MAALAIYLHQILRQMIISEKKEAQDFIML